MFRRHEGAVLADHWEIRLFTESSLREIPWKQLIMRWTQKTRE